jgi:hypothetical protein
MFFEYVAWAFALLAGQFQTPEITANLNTPNQIYEAMPPYTKAMIDLTVHVTEAETDTWENDIYDVMQKLATINQKALINLSIVLPESITAIGDSFLLRCYNLHSLTLSDSISHIGDAFLYECLNLTHLILPPFITTIGYRFLVNCPKINNLILPETLTHVGWHFLYTEEYINVNNQDTFKNI